MVWDLRPLIDRIADTVRARQLGVAGEYAKKPGGGLDRYGCADAANILYTIGRFPVERAACVEVLQRLQDADGLYRETVHHPFHTTAHCLAALELFDAKPLRPLAGMAHLAGNEALRAFLDQLDWRGNPWNQSHQGAGIYAARVLAGEATLDWQDTYFDWLWNEADEATGLWRRGCIGPTAQHGLFAHLAGTFHYLFNQEYAHRPLRYPERLVDFCLDQREQFAVLGRGASFAEIDWVYCITRGVRQSGHRHGDARRVLTEFAGRYTATLLTANFDDLHMVFGATCALAELQTALPGLLRTECPLKLVLDRRPFI